MSSAHKIMKTSILWIVVQFTNIAKISSANWNYTEGRFKKKRNSLTSNEQSPVVVCACIICSNKKRCRSSARGVMTMGGLRAGSVAVITDFLKRSHAVAVAGDNDHAMWAYSTRLRRNRSSSSSQLRSLILYLLSLCWWWSSSSE